MKLKKSATFQLLIEAYSEDCQRLNPQKNPFFIHRKGENKNDGVLQQNFRKSSAGINFKQW